MSLQFVALDAEGNEFEWIDPYISHEVISQAGGVTDYLVKQAVYSFIVEIPDEGSFVIKELEHDHE